MQIALDLAIKAEGNTGNNPMVGCVIVHNNEIIGQGYHEKYGAPHAEPNAISSVIDKTLISESDIYVSLEPCAHYGKTPPCADLIAMYAPKRLIVCNNDPNPLVSGKGYERIRAVGTEIKTGVLASKGRALNKRFFTFHEKKRPYVILKWAETQDGFIARKNYDSKWISNPDSRKIVHEMRARESAIMVGTNTALHDNPELNVRLVEGKNPVRVVIDRTRRLPDDYKLFDGSQETICFTSKKEAPSSNLEFVEIDFAQKIVPQIMSELYVRNIQSLIVEGGQQLLIEFIELDLWDEAFQFVGKAEFEEGIKAPELPVTLTNTMSIGDDLLRIAVNE